jgi:hypothetical protein
MVGKILVFSPDANRKFYSKRQQKWIKYHLFLIDEWANVKERIILREDDNYFVVKMSDLKIEMASGVFKIVNEFGIRKDSVYFDEFCKIV